MGDIRYLLWCRLPETGKLAVDGHIQLRVSNDSSQFNVCSSIMYLGKVPGKEMRVWSMEEEAPRPLHLGWMIWDKCKFLLCFCWCIFLLYCSFQRTLRFINISKLLWEHRRWGNSEAARFINNSWNFECLVYTYLLSIRAVLLQNELPYCDAITLLTWTNGFKTIHVGSRRWEQPIDMRTRTV